MKKHLVSNMLVACIVTFNPSISRLRENIIALCGGIGELLIVDNASSNYDEISQLTEELSAQIKISAIKNAKNMGIANALNSALNWADSNGYGWILTMDQDSVCNPGFAENMVPLLAQTDVGIFCPRIEDKNSILEERMKNKQRAQRNALPLPITSGAVVNVKHALEVDGFDGSFFIDCVDFDLDLKLLEKGYKIIQVENAVLLHNWGKPQNFRFIGLNLFCSGHNSMRCYYVVRNAFFLFRKHRKFAFKFTLRLIVSNLKTALLNVLSSKARLKYLLYGLYDGILGKVRTNDEILRDFNRT